MHFIIADDHILFREILGEYLGRYMPEAKTDFAGDFHAAYEMLQQGNAPDLVILDYNMRGMEGAKTIKQLKEEFPNQKVAMMSGVAQAQHIKATLDEGAVGYFPKTLSGKDFVKGIQGVVNGEVFVPVSKNTGEVMPSYYAEVNGLEPANQEEQNDFITQSDLKLTKREKQILSHLLKGETNREIAQTHGIQEVTVKMHVSRIFAKFGAKNRTQVVIKAKELGFQT